MSKNTTKFGPPVNFYTAKAQCRSNMGPSVIPAKIPTVSDSGVFVQSSNHTETNGTFYVGGQLPYRLDKNYFNCCFGMLNMYTKANNAKSFGIISYQTLTDANLANFGFAFFNYTRSDANVNIGGYQRFDLDAPFISLTTNNVKAVKTEAAFPTHYAETDGTEKDGEIVYATGLSLFDGNSPLQSIIIARIVDVDGSGYPSARIDSGVPYCDNGSIMFTGDGSCFGTIEGDNLGTSATASIVQAIPDKAMVGNGKTAALACMATVNGTAVYLSHKNGIYKLYQGATPLIGMPGDKVTIKGHEFACLAYGPFYIRMS